MRVLTMAYHPTSGQDPSPPAIPEAGKAFTQAGDLAVSADLPPVSETDLADLTARFAASSGPGLSPELSSELALEIVLHEIVEQACLATGATGAAIVLQRDGEMVCRASSGPTAPELGARLDGASGLSAECFRTGEVQRCEDAWSDPRADADASRQLGVRSVLAYPLVRGSEIVGIFEALSPRVSAFGERDERTLEALAGRALKNLEQAANPVIAPQEENVGNVSESREEPQLAETYPAPRRALDVVTWALAAAVLVCTVWLGYGVVRRFEPRRVGVQPEAVKVRSLPAQPSASASGNTAAPQSQLSPIPTTGSAAKTTAPAGGRARAARVPEGSLLVFENGKEVFRMPPNSVQANQAQEGGIERASSVESDRLTLTSDAAENNLLHRVEPEYPEEARRQQIQGAVVLDVRIDPDGSVENLRVVSGQPLLADAALAAVKQWRFRPQSVDGRQVKMQTRITIRFALPPG